MVIAENGSTDTTVAEAEGLAETFAEVRVLTSPVADYGQALKSGFLAADGDVVVNFDVDFVDLGFLDDAVELIASGAADIVVGSKRSPGSDDQRRVGRRVVTAVFSVLLRHGFGLHVSDTHGVKAMQARAAC